MLDAAMTVIIVAVLVVATSISAARYPRELRLWLWVALVEYMACAVGQLLQARIEGGDANYYRQVGIELARFLDNSFGWAFGELVSLLLQRPSAFDDVVLGPGTNTGSMAAAAAGLMFLSRYSEYAAQALVGGLAMHAAIAIFNAFRDAYPSASPLRLFFATVLFPSVAFWTSALHKESLCLMGMGLLLAAWRAIYKRQLRALVYGPLGFVLILVFRAPALPPILMGLVIHFVASRLQKTRGTDATLLGPVYMAIGLAILAGGMLLVTRVSPDLGLDQLGEAIATHQRAWSRAEGGSSFSLDEPLAQTPGEQIMRAPMALINALFRPQFFDVTNALVLLSALEMTAVTWMIFRAFQVSGFRGVLTRIQKSPFLLMCTVIVIVGCTFVGLTTLNFGSLARYRVPFLPFYGALLAILTERTAAVIAGAPSEPRPGAGSQKLRVGRGARPVRRGPARSVGAA